jgi:hypothetical protein
MKPRTIIEESGNVDRVMAVCGGGVCIRVGR